MKNHLSLLSQSIISMGRLCIVNILILFTLVACSASVTANYSRIVGEVTGDASYDADTLSAGGLALRVAKSMIGTKYVAGTLEREPERLRVSLDSTDCMLFVELCCSFALTLQSGEPSYTLLEDNIRQMRYRYYRRLHVAYPLFFRMDWAECLQRYYE